MTLEEQTLLWVERLGGWAVVIFIVRWGMLRMDRMIDTFQKSLVVFQKFEMAEKDTHDELRRHQIQMVETQNAILSELRDLHRSLS